MTLRLRSVGEALGWRWPILFGLITVVFSGCGAEAPTNELGGGGKCQNAEQAAENVENATMDEPNALHDPRWDMPNDLAQVSAPPSNATTCTAGNQCPTGNCVDGFCCDSKCDYPCMACSAAKKGSGVDGVCGSIAYDTDPDNDCPVGACDGKNQCKNYNGVPCTSTANCLSNYCVDGVCCGNICMGSCQACSAAKKGSGYDGVCGSVKAATDPDNECNPGECNGSGACNASPQPLNANGAACTSAALCQSGYCADGVCCDSWCLGTCMACTAAKKGGGVDGTCGFIPDDKDYDDECWAGACNGAGVCKQYNGLPCTDKSQCLSNYCVDGVCCGNLCTQFCYACTNAKKGAGYDGVCEPITAGRDLENECNPGECNGSGVCNQPQTPQANGTTCVSSGQCASGNCVDGVCCDTACSGNCQACTALKKGSGADGACGNIKAETDPDKECGYGRCGGNGICRYYNGTSCTAANQCFSNYCVDGFCCGNICTGQCYACSNAKKGSGYDGVCAPINSGLDPENECSPGECNGSGTCNQPQVLLVNGAACTSGPQCSSGFCVDGVCCDTACTGACQACSSTKKGIGTNGSCGNIKYDTDPDNECVNGACSGAGTCQFYNGLGCTTTTECLSNYCVDGFCCGNICDLSCMACSAAKKGSGYDGACGMIANNADPDNECGLSCNGSGACQPASNGASCTMAAQCASTFCVDGVCCDAACSGTCQACSAAKKGSGSDGQCGSIAVNTDPDNECAQSDCDGAGACISALPDGAACSSGSVCLSGHCVDGLCCNNACTSTCKACDVVGSVGTCTERTPGACKTCNIDKIGLPGPAFTQIYTSRWHDAAVVDLNNDGKVELIGWQTVNNIGSSFATINDVFGPTQQAYTSYSAANISSLTIADVNGDNKLDAITSHRADILHTGPVGVWLNNGDGTFAAVVNYLDDGVTRPGPTTVVDIDNDGDRDILMGSFNDAFLKVLKNQGNGTFVLDASYAADTYIESIAVADVSGDGIVDIVAGSGNSSLVQVFLGQGNGSFAAATNYTTGNAADSKASVRLLDLNGDGKLDIGLSNQFNLASPPSTSVLLNNGNGTFGTSTAYLYVSMFGDVSGDGKPDLVGTTYNSNAMSVRINQGNGTFGGNANYSTAATPRLLGTADINGDGKLDVITTNEGNTLTAAGGTISAWLNQGNGTFGTRVDSNGAATFIAAFLHDVNGDGALDVGLAFNKFGPYVSSFLNMGNGSFGPSRTIVSMAVPQAVTAADVNKDGNADLITFAESAMGVALGQGNGSFAANAWYSEYLGSRFRVFAADFNGDTWPDISLPVFLNNGNGTFAVPSVYSSFVGSNLFAPVDFNGDGKADLYGSQFDGVRVAINQGNGTFGASTLYALGSTKYMTAADVNGDGKADLITTIGGKLGVMLNQGLGTFATKVDYAAADGHTLVMDVSGDNIPDIVAATSGNGGPVRAFINQGNGTFPTSVDLAGDSGQAIGKADLNGDGLVDLYTASNTALYVRLRQNATTFASAVSYPCTSFALDPKDSSMIAADVNGDGFPEIVQRGYHGMQFVPNLGNGTFGAKRVFLGGYYGGGTEGEDFVTADFNRDGMADFSVVSNYDEQVAIMVSTCLP